MKPTPGARPGAPAPPRPFRSITHGAVALCCLLLGMAALGCTSHLDAVHGQFQTRAAQVCPPRSLAILPFENQTDTQGIDVLVRQGLYSQMGPLAFEDVELSFVDEQLQAVHAVDQEAIKDLGVAELGRLLNCDALVFGTVTRCSRIFVGFFSQLCLGASIRVVDARTGELVWEDEERTCFHDGGVPLGILDIPMTTVRSGLNMREIVKVRAVDELCRTLAARAPLPLEFSTPPPPQAFELQVGAFHDKERAIDMLAVLRKQEYPAFMRKDEQEDIPWYRILVGPYQTRIQAEQALEKVRLSSAPDAFIRPAAPLSQ